MKNLFVFFLLQLITISALFGQNRIVKGKVVDEEGAELPIVNIQIQGTDIITVTDMEGNYKINVPSDSSTLVYTFIGMADVYEKVNNRSVINVKLKQDMQHLEEVMVVAYGTSTKEAFTGSAEVVDDEVLKNRAVTSFDKALQGTTPGLMVSSSSGQPGATSTVRIRGIGSLTASSSPLYVLDGVPMTGSISDINPNDIASITVLKDAAAASLYGSRAANGVIIITTNQGKTGETKISLNSQFGVSSRVSDGYQLMNSSQIYEHSWMGLYNQGLLDNMTVEEARQFAHNSVEGIVGFNPFSSESPLDQNGKVIEGTHLHTNTNWRDELYKNGLINNHNLNITGGNDLTKVFFSLGYYDDTGTILSSNFTRYTSKVNVSHKINDFLTAGVNSMLSYSKTNAPPSGSGGANPVRSVEIINAASPVYNSDGTYNWDNNAVFDFNPIGLAEKDKYLYETKRGLLNAYLNVDFTKNFAFKTTLGVDNSINKGLNYYNPEHGNGAGVNGRSSMSQTDNMAWNISNLFIYNYYRKDFSFEILAGQEAAGQSISTLSSGVTDFSVDGYYDLVWGSKPSQPGSFTSEWTLVSYLGQAKVDINDKYYFSGSIRTDGSSRFGKNNKYGMFYSLGGGWRINNEAFMQDITWINHLKLRASYGTSGNNSIGNYQSLGLYGSGANYGGYAGLTPVSRANEDLQWEKITSFNAGFESRLFNKMSLSAEYYIRHSDGLLFNQPLSASKGFGSILTNLGAMDNKGVEVAVSYDIVTGPKFYSTIGFNLSTNENTIKTLTTDRIISGTKVIEEGGSMYQFYLREWAGVNPENGRPMWYVNHSGEQGEVMPSSAFNDPHGSGKMVTSEYNDAERVRLGTALPSLFGGLNYTLGYKNLELSMFVSFNYGNKVYNHDYAVNMHDGVHTGYNLAADALDAWTPDNIYTNVPRYVANNTDRGNEMSSRFLEDGSYVRLKNITLAYRLPKRLCEKAKLSGVRAFVSGENLLTFTNYKGFDPEMSINGVTGSNIPGVKVISTGFNLDF
ncbi:SusC/RagA family TonB-linked outer membrane protein [Flammeovirga yaeyamensis]|uniref:SusC/RagA family TonB-linked outer membrane protein n=1 Tax=Flammeovirga yaeyamensis TaxID=367791 RepID=A0AAX1ND14_9BACT|nr:TonB-dependent receptor [Flammeovirga yaeyamensis]MBB3697246.1 TonB-linked SusC/RagA family outer membrane protein [Flammeovirga yaeyamensis]NMF33904.1 TonB-dependent receptor [Flammeovirga yaeyamensis]QWG04836.1 SusC/RagA family TonB-linked outer membrane protein [Flammeovirga yaeyamensis]